MSRETVVVGALGLVAAVVYGLSCWWFPFKRCGCCKGRGVHTRKDGKVFRTCGGIRCLGGGCGGMARKLRVGRRAHNVMARLVKGAS